MRFSPGLALTGLATGVGVLLAGARLAVPAGQYGDLYDADRARFVVPVLAAGLLYLGAVAVVRSRPVPGWAVSACVAAGLLARLLFVVTPPVMSTDLYRYVWDGRVQRAGINPYLYKPADPALGFLRDGGTGPEAVFVNMNRADTARTIYPPAAQLLFAAIAWTVSSVWTVKAVMLACDLLAGAAVLGLLRAAGRPVAWIALWALNPLPVTEFAGAGHIDAAACAATGLTLLAASGRRRLLTGFGLGAAFLFKLLPAVVAPAVWRPRGWTVPVVAAGLVALLYGVYAATGADVLGYLPGYAQEEQLEGGGGFLLLRLLGLAVPLPGWAAPVYAGLALLGLAALSLLMMARPGPPRADVISRDALWLIGLLLAVLSPHYPWYLTLLAVPATVCPRWGALWPMAAGPLLYFGAGPENYWAPAIVFVPFWAWLLFELVRTRGSLHA